jgi:hypothetical protein
VRPSSNPSTAKKKKKKRSTQTAVLKVERTSPIPTKSATELERDFNINSAHRTLKGHHPLLTHWITCITLVSDHVSQKTVSVSRVTNPQVLSCLVQG